MNVEQILFSLIGVANSFMLWILTDIKSDVREIRAAMGLGRKEVDHVRLTERKVR